MSFISRCALPYLSSLLAVSLLLTLEMPAPLPEQLQVGPTLALGWQLPSPCRAVTQGLLQWHLIASLPTPLHYETMGFRIYWGAGLSKRLVFYKPESGEGE